MQTARKVANSEGHVYTGEIENGQWIDAANLQAGDRLLNDDNSWAEVVSVKVEEKPLTAYNLSVADFHTYFVAANENATPVWVHNVCFDYFEGARKKAISYIDEAGGINPATRKPTYGKFAGQEGKITGFDATLKDGRPVQYRIDYDPEFDAHIRY